MHGYRTPDHQPTGTPDRCAVVLTVEPKQAPDLAAAKGRGLDASHYETGPVDEATAKAFTVARHYSGAWPATVFSHGLYDITG